MNIYYNYGFFSNHDKLTDTGVARFRGVEIMIRKKLARDSYGLASTAYFRSQYKSEDGVCRNRSFDNRMLFSLEGGYKPNYRWEFSMRWIYAGGAPYTPFDNEASKMHHRTVFDEAQINEARYSDYHSMNIRFDRRFHFSGSNLIFYLSVWNVYDRKNIAGYFWNDAERKQDQIYQ
ncbi:hypothetical protein GF337_00610 [candidate division KSB1 bacterium]|nr:hypothetical protein [candidate division KSB1 bacterium]